jgi:hypothetical protein
MLVCSCRDDDTRYHWQPGTPGDGVTGGLRPASRHIASRRVIEAQADLDISHIRHGGH